jgi:hypothetical protein
MNCLLDLDGVLVNFVQGSLDIHGIKMDAEMLYSGNEGKWDFVQILGMMQPAFWKPMDEEFWAKLDPMPDCFQILELVENRFKRENVMILTSPSSNYGCHAGKIRWMERHLPRHYSKTAGHMFGSRKELLARPNNVLVDDRDKNVDDFTSHGGRAILVPRIWNRLHDIRHTALDCVRAHLEQ